MRLRRAIALALCALASGQALAHELQHSVHEGMAVSVTLSFADGSPFAFEAYEVYRADEDIPFQVGRTDAQGRVVFIPDRAGSWRVKAFSEDGHGVDFSFTTGVTGDVGGANAPPLARPLRILVGVSVIFGVFGLVTLLRRRGARS